MTWQESKPELLTIQGLIEWFGHKSFAPDDEIGKQGYAYASPVADAHNERDQSKKLQWTFSNMTANVFDEVRNADIEIELDVPYKMLYAILPTAPGENFQMPLSAALFKEALIEVQKLVNLIAFLRGEGKFLCEWADELETDPSSTEEAAQCMDTQAALLRQMAQSLRQDTDVQSC